MKLLMISTDEKIFEAGSAVRARMIEHGKRFDDLRIVVFTVRPHRQKAARLWHGHVKPTPSVRLSDKVTAYPTDSASKLLCGRDAERIAHEIIAERGFLPSNSHITTQDPFLTGLAGARIKDATAIPLEIQIHTDIGSPFFGYSWANRLRMRAALRSLPHADRIRVVSERIKEWLTLELAIPSELVDVRPIAVDTAAIKAAPIAPHADLHKKFHQFKHIVLMASRLTEEKDIPLALAAFSRVVSVLPGSGLVIVGSGPLEKKLRALARSLSLGDRVVFEPWANRATLDSYYKTADLFLLTSLYEGYGMVLVEAHAAGCPIVSTDVGIARELGASIAEHTAGSIAEKALAALSAVSAASASASASRPPRA